MKNNLKIAVGAVLGVVTWQSAYAADLPVKAPPPAVMAPAPTWTGCYIGGNVGATWGGGEISTNIATVGGSSNGASFAGGGQIGCDYQTGQFVFGIRNLFDWSSRSRNFVIPAGAFAGFGAGQTTDRFADRPGWLGGAAELVAVLPGRWRVAGEFTAHFHSGWR